MFIKIIKRSCDTTFKSIAYFLCFLVVARASATALMPFFSWDALYIFSYIPPHLLFVLSGLCTLIFYPFKKKTIIPSLLFGLSFFSYAVDGDHSIKKSLFGNKPAYAYADSDPIKSNFSVMALNVQFYFHSFDKVFSFLKQHQADIILLSENQFKPEQYEELLSSKGYFLKNYQWPSTDTCTTIMSKHEIISYKNIELPSPQVSIAEYNSHEDLDALPRRQFAHAKIKIGNDVLNFISLRFIAGRAKSQFIWDQISWGLTLYRYQKREIAFVKEYLAKLTGPVIVGGDLNLTPGSGFVKELTENLIDSNTEHNLFGGRTFRNEVLSSIRLDYLLHSKELINLGTEVLNKEKVSDHYAIMGKFTI